MAVTESTNVKSRLRSPVPCTGNRDTAERGVDESGGIAAVYVWPAGCSGPYTLKKVERQRGQPIAGAVRERVRLRSQLRGRVRRHRPRGQCLDLRHDRARAVHAAAAGEDRVQSTVTPPASSTATVPVALARWLATGSTTLRGTLPSAPRCTMASARRRRTVEGGVVEDRSLQQLDVEAIEVLRRARRQIIEDDDRIDPIGRERGPTQVGPDEPRPARHEHSHPTI